MSTRNSAYSVPQGTWAFEAGALGIGGGDLYATIGASYGIGAGLQVSMNIAHAGVGLFNIGANWHFIDTRYFDLGMTVGFLYGHGEWFWVARGLSKEVISKLDVIHVPLELTASAPLTRWLQLDLHFQYSYADLWGTTDSENSIFTNSELGLRTFFVQPGVRIFLSDSTAFEFFAKLPAYSAIPREGDDIKVPFSDTWALEWGLRSRIAGGLFWSTRLHYGSIVNVLYGSHLYPSFGLEFRP